MCAEIKLKLISGSKIILADCVGYESELFIPKIINNRIVLQNAVLSRQCCNQESPIETTIRVKKSKLNPLANSTPSEKINIGKENKKSTVDTVPCFKSKRVLLGNSSEMNLTQDVTIKPQFNIQQAHQSKVAKILPNLSTSSQYNEGTSSTINRFPTPDIVRRAVVQNTNDIIPSPQRPQITELKIVRLHRVNTPNTPKSLGRIIRSKTPLSNCSSPRVLRNLSNMSSFGSPPSLQQSKEIMFSNCATPNQSFLANKIKTPCTATKWRKCLTPRRTYMRQSNGKKELPKSGVAFQLQLSKNKKFAESYRYPMNSENRLIIKRRKLIIDKDLKITPEEFKKQLTNTEDLNRSKFQLPKSRRHFHRFHMTAFDLLTNSNFYPKISKNLNAVFRESCVNKYASTILKYKQLTNDIPMLREVQ